MAAPRRAVVDVDGTLWNLWLPVRETLLRLGVASESDLLEEAPHWNHHRDAGVSDAVFYQAVHACHAAQIGYPPFEGAFLLFDALNRRGFEVIVASHRKPQTAHLLGKWLRRYGLEPYSGLYTGANKHFLISAGDLVIDDSPDTIIEVQRRGAQSLSLEWAYNREALQGQGSGGPKPIGFKVVESPAVKGIAGSKISRNGPTKTRGLEGIARWVLENR